MVLVLGQNFDSLIAKEGEAVTWYVHSFETSRDATTNLRESKWTSGVSIIAVVRSQPKVISQIELGLVDLEVIILLTKTQLASLDIVKWNGHYFDVLAVEETFFRGKSQYYKATCSERLEFLGN